MGNWLDNVVAFISPEKGYEREAWRQGLDGLRNYDAGDNGRLNANWRAINDSAENTDRYSRDTIRARARDLERNSDMENAVIGAFKRNVVGGGYGLQARSENEVINEKIEKYWKIWCKKNNCDVTATQNFNQILRMAVQRKKVDGGMLIHKTYTEGGIVPFKLQCLEVDELDIMRITPTKSENRVIGGIEYNSFNKAVGYHIKQYSLDGFSIQESKYIEAKDMIFYFSKKRPSQVREISDLCPTITRIRDVNEFMVAVSVKERIMACLSAWIKKATPQGVGRGSSPDSGTGKYDYEGKSITPGMIKYLNPGEELQVVNPSGQSAEATDYIKLNQRLISASQGVSYEATSRDMAETNYSSARQALIEDELTYTDEKELILEIMDEIYETFVISGVLCGLFDIKDFWSRKDDYLMHEWIQTPKRWIDPAKEATANKTAINTGQKTFKQIAAENGKDWKEQLDDMAETLNYANELGINLGGMLYAEKSKEKNGSAK